jgi:hypothetical protein
MLIARTRSGLSITLRLAFARLILERQSATPNSQGGVGAELFSQPLHTGELGRPATV